MTVTGSPPASTATVTGLTNGTAYTFTVTATNSIGTGPASAPSNAVTPGPVPAAPTGGDGGHGRAGCGDGQLDARLAGGSDHLLHGHARSSGSTAGTPVTVTGSPPATSTTLSGLTNGTTYTFEVSAHELGRDRTGLGRLQLRPRPSPPIACPCNVFGSQTPGTVDSGERLAVNLGMAFTTDTNGYITGARFYKASTNTGTHVGSLWSASGTLLAQATFTGETASGWQQVSFSTPVAVTAGTTYVVSYYDPNGHYSVGASLANQVNAPPLYALASAAAPNGNGVYLYGSSPAFPTSTYSASNYYVDPVFSTTAVSPPAAPTGVSAVAGSAVGDGQLDGARRRLRHLLHRDPVRWLDGGHAGDGHRVAAGHLDHGERAHQRHHLHLRGVRRPTRRGRGRSRRPPTPSPRRRRTRRADRGHGCHGGPGCGDGQLDRRQAALVTSYTVTPFVGSTAGTPVTVSRVAAGHLDHGERADQRHHLHLRGVGDRTQGARALQSAPSNLVTPESSITCPCDVLGTTTPDHGRLGRHDRGQPRDGLHHRHQRLHHRGPLLQGIDQHRHPRGQPVERERHAAGPGHLHQRDGLGLAAGLASRHRWR